MKKKILFIVTEDWYFISHRFHLAKQALEKGYAVYLLSNFSVHRATIDEAGIKTINWGIKRSSKNIFAEISVLINMTTIFKKIKPDLIHSVALKPVIYSGLSGKISNVRNFVFALAGLGIGFTSSQGRFKLLRLVIILLFRLIFKGQNTRLILQNEENMKMVKNLKLIESNKIHLIKGVGVDTKLFKPGKRCNDIPLIILPGRMLWSKGIREFIECAKKINKINKRARFVLIGNPDKHNPDSLTKNDLLNLKDQGDIDWWGYKEHMERIFKQANIVCLPSTYGEGLPKVLIEAASCGLPIVTYDVAGCREVVEHKKTGFLVSRDRKGDFTMYIETLLDNPKLSEEMGKRARKLILKDFYQEKSTDETISVWSELL